MRISFSLESEALVARFSDSGPGIPAYRTEKIFTDRSSSEGLGLGLSLSRELAQAMGGTLNVEDPGDPGAVFRLVLPASAETLPSTESDEPIPEDKSRAYSPRSRLLIDLAAALSEQTLDHVVGGIQKLYSELVGATGALLLVARPDGSFLTAGPYGGGRVVVASESTHLATVVTERAAMRIDDTDVLPWATADVIGGSSAMLLPVNDGEAVVGVLAVGWKTADSLPRGAAEEVTTSLADLTAPAIARAALSEDILFERRLRSSVMNELPIAVSIFAGDPPQVIDMNRKEREMLMIDNDQDRSRELGSSQAQFSVRFADGTPLTVDNAPVTTTIRTGRSGRA